MTTPKTATPQGGATSRDSVEGAGWDCAARDLNALLPPEGRDKPPFRWFHFGTLWRSRNDQLAKRLGDPSPIQRERWLEDWYGERRPDPRIDRSDLAEPSFLLLGDTGEGDTSQYALLSLLREVGRGTEFMVI